MCIRDSTDSPRFTWRGIMIDSGRNPRSIAELKTIIDLLACYKVNTDVYKRQPLLTPLTPILP